MNEQIVGKATIAPYRCLVCSDTGILTGVAELDGELVVVHKICRNCPAAGKQPVQREMVVYDD